MYLDNTVFYLLVPPPTPGVLVLKQGGRACCHCSYIFHDLSNFSANCEPDASNGFPQLTTNSPVRDAVMEPELPAEMLVLFLLHIEPWVSGGNAQI